MRRRIAVLAVTAMLLLACSGNPASGGPNCGAIESPCKLASDTVPSGWSTGQLVTGDGRTVLCVVFANPMSGSSRSPSISCDWQAK